jgi:Zn-dependent peptidase ImmA (M78 family)
MKNELRRGFKAEAESYAEEFRKELHLRSEDPLCPWKLAEYLEIPVHPLSRYKNQIPNEVDYYMKDDAESFSAITIFDGLRRLIIHNDAHHPHRQASNISHEISHGILAHPPAVVFDRYGNRHFNKEHEDEANWLGPALLISKEAALHIVKKGMNYGEASILYKVSPKIIRAC